MNTECENVETCLPAGRCENDQLMLSSHSDDIQLYCREVTSTGGGKRLREKIE
jgi:hypothetical protein